ncbi:hypothetical protein Syun_017044 [Stephania yunnanensis]|uniref:SET domain-containing protein n=1 Tax=Stephania yunnanensis TaxID=152371 RepID=A0AAP0J5V3_9MAGN
MERLKSEVPSTLIRKISSATTEQDLLSTSSALLDFFLSHPLFNTVARELADPELALCGKNRASALDLKRKGNESFSHGHFDKALNLYSQALRVAPMDDRDLVATLYLNRASSLFKMGLFTECRRDCDRAVVLSPSYAKAWYRRAKVNASLKSHNEAINDMNVALNLEPSIGLKRQIKEELVLIVNSRQSCNSLRKACHKSVGIHVESPKIKLQCVSTPDKGRGMVSISDISDGSLIHSEEPYVVILSKHYRETHCHFCMNELPVDSVPCSSCSVPLYCSQWCLERAGGVGAKNLLSDYPFHEMLPTDLQRYISSVILAPDSRPGAANPDSGGIAEHKHECGGVNWFAVLPSEIILAARMIVKSIEQRKRSEGTTESAKTLELVHNFGKLPIESKLDFHIYSIVLTHCLQQSYGAEFPLTGASVSQLVIAMSQVKLNAMAIVHMKSTDAFWSMEQLGNLLRNKNTLTNNVEQVRLGQAIYSTGSLFNHSCRPNVHTYFLSRTLFVRSTEFVQAGFPLELSYGPQVGQWSRDERQQLLQDQYSFKCNCSGCAQLNVSDIVISSFSCLEPNCFGIVLDDSILKLEKLNFDCVQQVPTIFSLKSLVPVDKPERGDIEKVARCVLKHHDVSCTMVPGYCLNCGSHCDVKSLRLASSKAIHHMERALIGMLDDTTSTEVRTNLLSDALSALDILRSILHAYNKEIAQAEDNLAKALCLIGDFQSALHYCEASIGILEKLYHPKHIVIGNELVKLASIQLCTSDHISALNTIDRLNVIFQLYYGSHAMRIFPYLDSLKKDAAKLALENCAL